LGGKIIAGKAQKVNIYDIILVNYPRALIPQKNQDNYVYFDRASPKGLLNRLLWMLGFDIYDIY